MAVGKQSRIFTYDGANWTAQPIDIANPVALYVTVTDAWAVGRNGTIMHRTR